MLGHLPSGPWPENRLLVAVPLGAMVVPRLVWHTSGTGSQVRVVIETILGAHQTSR
jgi:hypothetical protein